MASDAGLRVRLVSAANFGGPWTQEKLDILRRYLNEYTTVLKNQRFTLIYVDAFAGKGYWTPASGYESDDYADFAGVREGSPRIALEIQDKAFDRLVFIDTAAASVRSLQSLREEFPAREIRVFSDDANDVLKHFCGEMKDFDRAVVFLDPYATQVAWSTVEAVARSRKIDCWILFPLMAVQRLMPRNSVPTPALAETLDRIFGGREHWQNLYSQSPQLSLFGEDPAHTRLAGSGRIADLYRERLHSVFVRVAATRRTFRNSKGSPMFELFFGASNPVGAPPAIRIADYILSHW